MGGERTGEEKKERCLGEVEKRMWGWMGTENGDEQIISFLG